MRPGRPAREHGVDIDVDASVLLAVIHDAVAPHETMKPATSSYSAVVILSATLDELGSAHC